MPDATFGSPCSTAPNRGWAHTQAPGEIGLRKATARARARINSPHAPQVVADWLFGRWLSARLRMYHQYIVSNRI